MSLLFPDEESLDLGLQFARTRDADHNVLYNTFGIPTSSEAKCRQLDSVFVKQLLGRNLRTLKVTDKFELYDILGIVDPGILLSYVFLVCFPGLFNAHP